MKWIMLAIFLVSMTSAQAEDITLDLTRALLNAKPAEHLVDGVLSIVDEITLEIAELTGGSVIIVPYQDSYSGGDQVTLTATAEPGMHFVNWTGDATSEDNPVTITLDSDKSIGAVFENDVTVAVSSVSSHHGDTNVPVSVIVSGLGTRRIASMDLTVRYDATKLEAVDVQRGELIEGPHWNMLHNINTPGEIIFGFLNLNTEYLLDSGGGEIAKLIFNVK